MYNWIKPENFPLSHFISIEYSQEYIKLYQPHKNTKCMPQKQNTSVCLITK